ncbi:hypothetical protein ES703_12965 [subsurface metagenome]
MWGKCGSEVKMKQHKRPIFTGIIILLLLIISCKKPTCPSEQGPVTLWTRTFGGTGYDNGSSVQQTSDGGYIIVGRTTSFGAGGFDVYLIKTDANGNPSWTKTYGGENKDESYSVQQTLDGGYIIAGRTNSYGSGDYNVYLVKTDAKGDTIWTKTYGGEGDDFGGSVQQTNDGGYIIAGWTDSFGASGTDVYLIKTDANGDTLWAKTYGGSNSDTGRSVQQTSDGGYIIVGATGSFGTGQRAVYLIKTDSDGNTIWTRTYGGEGLDSGHSVQQTSEGGYIITGSTSSYGSGVVDVYLIKTNENGDTLWTKTYGGSNSDKGYNVRETSDVGYIIAGYTDSFGAGEEDVYLIKTDNNGDTDWTKTYGGTYGDIGFSVQQTSDGGYIIVGLTYSLGASLTDVYLIKIR